MNRLSHIILFSVFSLALMFSANARAQSTFSSEKLKDACINYIKKNIKDDVEIAITQKIETQKFSETGIKAKCNGNLAKLRGFGYVNLEFIEDNKTVKRIAVPVNIKYFANVPVCKKHISRSSIISSDDFEVRRMDITGYNSSDFSDPNLLIGSKARVNISEGKIIGKVFIEEKQTIKRGDKVNIISVFGAVCVKAEGTALQDGKIGQKIRVKRDGLKGGSTPKILDAEISSVGIVVIN